MFIITAYIDRNFIIGSGKHGHLSADILRQSDCFRSSLGMQIHINIQFDKRIVFKTRLSDDKYIIRRKTEQTALQRSKLRGNVSLQFGERIAWYQFTSVNEAELDVQYACMI